MQATWKTPEFWAALIGQIIGIIVLMGGLTAEQGDGLKMAIGTIIGGIMSILTIFGFLKAQASRKTAAAALLIARLNKQGGDPLTMATAGTALDAEIKALYAQL